MGTYHISNYSGAKLLGAGFFGAIFLAQFFLRLIFGTNNKNKFY